MKVKCQYKHELSLSESDNQLYSTYELSNRMLSNQESDEWRKLESVNILLFRVFEWKTDRFSFSDD